MEEVSGGPWKGRDHTSAESMACQEVPAVVGAHTIKLGSAGHPAQSTALGASEALPPPWWGGFPIQWVSPGDRAMRKGRGLVSGKGREVEKGSGPGPVGRGKAPGSPSLLPRDKAPWCWAPPPPQALLTAAVLCHEWGLSSTAPLAWPHQVEPQDSGSQKRSWGGSPRVASGKGLQQVGQIRSVPRQAPLAAVRGQLCRWGSLSLAGSDPRAQPPGLAGLPPRAGVARGLPPSLLPKEGRARKERRRKPERAPFPFKSPDGHRAAPAAPGGTRGGRPPPRRPEPLFQAAGAGRLRRAEAAVPAVRPMAAAASAACARAPGAPSRPEPRRPDPDPRLGPRPLAPGLGGGRR